MASFCSKDKQYTDSPQWFDNLGPNQQGQHAPTGGPEARSRIFDYLGNYAPQLQQDSDRTAGALSNAANDPAWGTIAQNARDSAGGQWLGGGQAFNDALSNFSQQQSQLDPTYAATLRGDFTGQSVPTVANSSFRATQPGVNDALARLRNETANPSKVTQDTLSGRYLNSTPGLDVGGAVGAARRANSAEAADTGANIRSQFARAGMGFSTAQSQAEQANRAAASARSDEMDTGLRLAADQQRAQAYQAERALQANAAGNEDAAQRALGTFGAGARISADQFDQNVAAGRDTQERGLQGANYMQERGIQNQAAQDNQGAKRDASTLEATARLGNYGKERESQQNAAQTLAAAQAAPLQYLSQIPSQYIAPIQQISQIIQGLAGNGQIATPQSTIVRQPGIWDQMLSGVGAVAGAAGGGGW